MRKLFVHPIPAVLLLLLLSVSVQPTSPVVDGPDAARLAATTLNADGDEVQEGPCWLSCYTVKCGKDSHWAWTLGDRSRWDGGNHGDCWPKKCGYPPDGKHAPCTPGEALTKLDEAVAKAQADQLAEILADSEAVVLNSERRAIQVWSTCQEGELGAHLPLPSGLFDALVFAQDQDAVE